MLASENIAGATHVCGKLIDLIKSAVYDRATKPLVPQVAYREIVGCRSQRIREISNRPREPKTHPFSAF